MQKETLKVLVIDDHMLMRNLLTQCLVSIGIKDIKFAANGNDALEEIKSSQNAGKIFDVIMADWNMPMMNGFELLQKVRGELKLSKTAFVMITAESEKGKIMEALQAGVTSYIVKPFSPEDISKHMAKVMNWLESNRG
ncbi:MAG TPA: response regulator [Alphaproteobacteria bacterium]|nr:response regulator [Alphaproteobacteria bacterium]